MAKSEDKKLEIAMLDAKERLEDAITLGNIKEAERQKQMYLWLKELSAYRDVIDEFRSDYYSTVSKSKYFNRILRIRSLMKEFDE